MNRNMEMNLTLPETTDQAPKTGRAPAAAAPQPSLLERAQKALRSYDPQGYAEAVGLFRDCLSGQPNNASALAGLAETYAYWGFRRELEGKDAQSYYDLAYETAERSVQVASGLADAHRAMAVALRRGDKADAERRKAETLIAIELAPEDARAWYEHWKAFGYDPEDPSIFKALDFDPKLFPAHHDLAVVLCEHGRLDEAIDRMRTALEMMPRNGLGLYNLAMFLHRKGIDEGARRIIRHAAAVCPGDPLIASGASLIEQAAGGGR